jgi:hypothetical protein
MIFSVSVVFCNSCKKAVTKFPELTNDGGRDTGSKSDLIVHIGDIIYIKDAKLNGTTVTMLVGDGERTKNITSDVKELSKDSTLFTTLDGVYVGKVDAPNGGDLLFYFIDFIDGTNNKKIELIMTVNAPEGKNLIDTKSTEGKNYFVEGSAVLFTKGKRVIGPYVKLVLAKPSSDWDFKLRTSDEEDAKKLIKETRRKAAAEGFNISAKTAIFRICKIKDLGPSEKEIGLENLEDVSSNAILLFNFKIDKSM